MKLKKLIASMCGIAMLSATFAAFSVSAAAMTPSVTLASGTVTVASSQSFAVKLTGQSTTWTSGAMHLAVPKGTFTSTADFKVKNTNGATDADDNLVSVTRGYITKSKTGVCVFDDVKYDVMAFTFASSSAYTIGTDDVLFNVYVPTRTADLDVTVLDQSYIQQDSDNTYYYSTTTKTYTWTAGTNTIAEAATKTTASGSPYDMTKLGLYTNPDNSADQAVAWTVTVKADGSYDQVNYVVTDNSVKKTTGDQALTGTSGGGDVMYGVAVGWLGSGALPQDPTATATFSKKG